MNFWKLSRLLFCLAIMIAILVAAAVGSTMPVMCAVLDTPRGRFLWIGSPRGEDDVLRKIDPIYNLGYAWRFKKKQ